MSDQGTITTPRAALICGLLLGQSVLLGAQAPTPQDAAQVTPQAIASPSSKTVFFRYRDKALSDPEWARMASVLSAGIPAASWPTFEVRDERTLTRLLDRYYDIEADALPDTARTLIDLIKRTNDISGDAIKAGQVVKMPPLPVLSQLAASTDTSTRVFVPTLNTYAVISETGDVKMLKREDESAAVIKRFRRANETDLAVRAEVAALLPPGVGEIAHPPEHVQVRLFQSERCPPLGVDLGKSPYLASALERVKAQLAGVVKAAGTTGLTLIDFDFTDGKGHGADVRSAVQWLLDGLHIDSALNDFISVADLNPTAHKLPKGALAVALSRPSWEYWTWGSGKVAQGAYMDALIWIASERPAVSK